jgi:hypothetical protein
MARVSSVVVANPFVILDSICYLGHRSVTVSGFQLATTKPYKHQQAAHMRLVIVSMRVAMLSMHGPRGGGLPREILGGALEPLGMGATHAQVLNLLGKHVHQ